MGSIGLVTPVALTPSGNGKPAGIKPSENGAVEIPAQRFDLKGNSVAQQALSPEEISKLARSASRGLVEVRSQQLAEERNKITLDDYWEIFYRNPKLQLRSISQYTRDAIDWADKKYGSRTVRKFGKDLKDFAFSKLPWRPSEIGNRDALYGQLLPWNRFYKKLLSFERYAFPNNFILFHGPTSTGKSIGFDALFELLSEYSQTEEGALYSTEFIFPNKRSHEDFGLQGIIKRNHESCKGEEKRRLPLQKDIAAQIPSNQRTNPFFLFDLKERLKKLDEITRLGLLSKDFNTSFAKLYKIDDVSQRILNGLIELYKEDGNKGNELPEQVLDHIRINRWYMSCTNGDGIIRLQPSSAPGTYLKPIIPEIPWEDLPSEFISIISGAKLEALEGYLNSAQVLYYDDMFADVDPHHRLDDYTYLLSLAEKAKAHVSTPNRTSSKVVQTNIMVCGTANDSVLRVTEKIDPVTFSNLMTRGEKVDVGYQPLFRDIEEFLNKKLRTLITEEEFNQVSPNVIYALSLFTSMTYVFPCLRENYYNGLKASDDIKEKLKNLVSKLTPLEKVLLYEDEKLDSYETDPKKFKFNTEALKILYDHTSEIHDEYVLGSADDGLYLYEGVIGIPPRYIEKMVADAVLDSVCEKPDGSFTLIDLFRVLESKCKLGFEYESELPALFTQLKEKKIIKEVKENPFTNSAGLLALVKNHSMKRVSYEVRKATGLLKSRKDILTDFTRYLMHVKAYSQNQSVPKEWRVSSNEEKPDESFMSQTENNVFSIPGSKASDFRSSILSRLAAWQIGNEGKKYIDHLDTSELFKEQLDKLEAANMTAYNEALRSFTKDLEELVNSSPSFDISHIPEIPLDKEKAIEFAKEYFSGISLSSSSINPERKLVLLRGVKGLYDQGYRSLNILKKDVIFALGKINGD